MKFVTNTLLTMTLLATTAVPAAEKPVGLAPSEEEGKSGIKAPGYSPYAGRNFPTRVLWGDTHLHTNLSLDARAFGVILGPEEAYCIYKGRKLLRTFNP